MSKSKYSGIKPTRRDYCQFILLTIANYTLTYMAEHHPVFSHDAINRYLAEDDASSPVVWSAVKDEIHYSENACLIFDDTVLDKRYSSKIELVRHPYSGNEHGVIKGIGVVNCLYVNLARGNTGSSTGASTTRTRTARPSSAACGTCSTTPSKTKNCRSAPWLWTPGTQPRRLMTHIDKAGKVYYCPLKCNRLVDDSQGKNP